LVFGLCAESGNRCVSFPSSPFVEGVWLPLSKGFWMIHQGLFIHLCFVLATFFLIIESIVFPSYVGAICFGSAPSCIIRGVQSRITSKFGAGRITRFGISKYLRPSPSSNLSVFPLSIGLYTVCTKEMDTNGSQRTVPKDDSRADKSYGRKSSWTNTYRE